MTDFAAHLTEDRRLVILRLLKDVGGTLNDSNTLVGLHRLGHRRGVTEEVVRSDLEWLKERRLVEIETCDVPGGIVMIATLTRKGLNVANGDDEVVGVRKPSVV